MTDPRVRPCWGQAALFDSTRPADHARAKEFCLRCPVIDWCEGELQKARSLPHGHATRGTWAGRLIADPGDRKAKRSEIQRRSREKKRATKQPSAASSCLDCGVALTRERSKRTNRCVECAEKRTREMGRERCRLRRERLRGQVQRPSKDPDPAVVERIISGDYKMPSTNAERREVIRIWQADGISNGEIVRRTGWNVWRYLRAEQEAS